MNNAMNNHMNNISRLVGHDVSNKYNYVLSSDDLARSFYESKKDLQYSLRKEAKRDRYVYNGEGLQEAINDICVNAISNASGILVDTIATNTVDEIVYQLNGLIQCGNGKVVCGRRGNGHRNNMNKFIQSLTKGLIKGVSKIVEDMTKND